jgi:hypothetical protein
MTQDVTIRKLEDIPNAIEQFIMDQVVDYLKKYLFGPILQTVADAKEVSLHYQLRMLTKLTTLKCASKAIAKLTDFFNMVGSEVVAVMTDLGNVCSNRTQSSCNIIDFSYSTSRSSPMHLLASLITPSTKSLVLLLSSVTIATRSYSSQYPAVVHSL